MKDNYTSITIVLDRSGSMESIADDTVGGLNHFISEQKKLAGDVTLSLYTFNEKVSSIYNFEDLKKVLPLTRGQYKTFGCTALLDALGNSINEVGVKLSNMEEKDRPSKVIFLIITDGLENASNKFSKSKVIEMIDHQQNKYSWSFVFMGANIDSFTEAKDFGISSHNTMNYDATSEGVRGLYTEITDSMTRFRLSTDDVKVGFFKP